MIRSNSAGAIIVAASTFFGGCVSVTTLEMASAPAATKAELGPTGTLRIAVFTGNPVIGSKDKTTGELKGTTVAIGRDLATQAGLPSTLIEYTNIAKMVEDAKSSVWDIAVVSFDPARRNVLDFAPLHISVDLTYLVPPGKE